MALCVMLARQRAGTGALGSILDQHPDIQSVGEVFHPDHLYDDFLSKWEYFNFLLKKIKEDPYRGLPTANTLNCREYSNYLESLSQKRYIIIDVKYDSTHFFNTAWYIPVYRPEFLNFIIHNKYIILHIKRNNYLKNYISGLIADANKVWHLNHDDTLAVTKVTVSITSMLNDINFMKECVILFDKYLKDYSNVLEIEYEDLFDGDNKLMETTATKIAQFLNIDHDPFKSIQAIYKKQTSADLSSVIENYEEVENCLKDTEFSWMLTK